MKQGAWQEKLICFLFIKIPHLCCFSCLYFVSLRAAQCNILAQSTAASSNLNTPRNRADKSDQLSAQAKLALVNIPVSEQLFWDQTGWGEPAQWQSVFNPSDLKKSHGHRFLLCRGPFISSSFIHDAAFVGTMPRCVLCKRGRRRKRSWMRRRQSAWKVSRLCREIFPEWNMELFSEMDRPWSTLTYDFGFHLCLFSLHDSPRCLYFTSAQYDTSQTLWCVWPQPSY